MSRGNHNKLKKLPKKLLTIRLNASFTQKEVLNHINDGKGGDRSLISHFETGKCEPSLYQLLKYVELGNKSHYNVKYEDLFDDQKDPFNK